MTTARSHRRYSTRRVLASAGATLALVIVMLVDHDAATVHAANMWGTLREPGQPAFIAGHRGDRTVVEPLFRGWTVKKKITPSVPTTDPRHHPRTTTARLYGTLHTTCAHYHHTVLLPP